MPLKVLKLYWPDGRFEETQGLGDVLRRDLERHSLYGEFAEGDHVRVDFINGECTFAKGVASTVQEPLAATTA